MRRDCATIRWMREGQRDCMKREPMQAVVIAKDAVVLALAVLDVADDRA